MGKAPPEAKLALRPLLIDTGPLVAYLNRKDSAHREIAPFIGSLTGMLATTSAVVTEAMHLLRRAPDGPRRLVEFLEAAQVEVVDWTRPSEFLEAVALMEKYADAPMDFADATLVLLADRIGTGRVVTLDRRGFAIYRSRKGRRFEVLPS